MTYRGKDVWKSKPPQSHIEHDITLTYVNTARYWGITPETFRGYETEEQAEMIAAMICNNQLEAVIADERHREMVRQSRRR